METYSSSNAAAHDSEERVQPRKPEHHTIYKTIKVSCIVFICIHAYCISDCIGGSLVLVAAFSVKKNVLSDGG